MNDIARKVLGVTLGAIATFASMPLAAADHADAVVGRFDVKYEGVTSNCENTGMALTRGAIDITKRKAQTVAVDIDRIPIMVGSASKGGRVKATSKLGKTSIQGLDGRFSVAGSINDDGVLSMVFVAEYYVQGKAYCTQSWNISGVRGAVPEEGDGKKTDDLGVDAARPFATRMAPVD